MNQKRKIALLVAILPIILLLWAGAFLLTGNEQSNIQERQESVSDVDKTLEEIVIHIPDPALETALRETLMLFSGSITNLDADNVESLSLRNQGITDLTGLEYFTELQELDLRDNKITELASLAQLAQLTTLNVRGNLIEDITPLQQLTSLERLNVRENLITDINPLKELPLLVDINLRYNQISDVSPLQELESLTERLYINGNPIVDNSVLAHQYPVIRDKDFTIGPRFSHYGGFYEEAFQLELASYDSGTIYYTIDGSEPDPVNNPENTYTYTEPIEIHDRSRDANEHSAIRTANDSIYTFWQAPAEPVFKGTVIRAKLEKPDGRWSDTVTHTYFVHENGEARYSFPVLSIATETDSFFHEENGLFVNGNWDNRGRDSEREASIEFYGEDGRLGFSQQAGVRIHGGWSREAPQKSLRLYARDDYGTNLFYYDFFGNVDNLVHKRLILRNSGNDFHRTMFRDGLIQGLVSHMNMDTQGFRPAVVFINGEYWGIQNIRERYDHWYVENQYGVDRDHVTIVENDGILDSGSPAGVDHFQRMMEFVDNNDLRDDENYQHVNTMMDVENFIDYTIAQVYMANTDWPGHNVRLWRYNPLGVPDGDAPVGHDGRWRWMLFDTDYGFGVQPGLGFAGGSSVDTNGLARLAGDGSYQRLFRKLMANEEVKVAFVQRFSDMLNTAFLPERVVSEVDRLEEIYRAEISEHMERWNIPASMDVWEVEVDVMRRFAEGRPFHQWQHLQDFFLLGTRHSVTVENSSTVAGTVRVNSVVIVDETHGVINGSSWTGEYFEGLPVVFKAVPNEGYTFVGWEGIEGTGERVEVMLDGDMVVEPIFEEIE
ncbi:MAG: CotH kinase family protein [Bacillus sp. (in: Bacteria)]|nr:CotH kinase family protein [Bacillus sp. (in: firmicutes)]